MIRTTILMLLGFLLFLFGFISLVLTLVGLRLSFLSWIDEIGPGVGITIRILMIFGGVIIVYLTRSKFEK